MAHHSGSHSLELEVAAAGPELDDDGHTARTGTTNNTDTLSCVERIKLLLIE